METATCTDETQYLNLTFYQNLAADSPKYVREGSVCTLLSEVKMKLYIIVRPTGGGNDNVEGSPLSTHCHIPLRIAGTRRKCNKE